MTLTTSGNQFLLDGKPIPHPLRRDALLPGGTRILARPAGENEGVWIEHGRDVLRLEPARAAAG